LRAAKVHMVRRCKPNAIDLADRRLALHWRATVDEDGHYAFAVPL
jgi:hypothetical protein